MKTIGTTDSNLIGGTVHIFEHAGLGQAPYRYMGIEKQYTFCEYCGTPILFKFWLLSKDGKRFFVGSDCIYKSGDAGLARLIDADVKKHQKELRDERNNALLEQFKRYLALHPEFFTEQGPFKGQPHPHAYYARQGRTLGSFHEWMWKHCGVSKRATMARRWLLLVGETLPARKTGARTAQKTAKPVRTPRQVRVQRQTAVAPVQPPVAPVTVPEPVVEEPVQRSFGFKKIQRTQ